MGSKEHLVRQYTFTIIHFEGKKRVSKVKEPVNTCRRFTGSRLTCESGKSRDTEIRNQDFKNTLISLQRVFANKNLQARIVAVTVGQECPVTSVIP